MWRKQAIYAFTQQWHINEELKKVNWIHMSRRDNRKNIYNTNVCTNTKVCVWLTKDHMMTRSGYRNSMLLWQLLNSCFLAQIKQVVSVLHYLPTMPPECHYFHTTPPEHQYFLTTPPVDHYFPTTPPVFSYCTRTPPFFHYTSVIYCFPTCPSTPIFSRFFFLTWQLSIFFTGEERREESRGEQRGEFAVWSEQSNCQTCLYRTCYLNTYHPTQRVLQAQAPCRLSPDTANVLPSSFLT